MKRYAIVGASAAGLSCAKTLRTLDPDCEITCLRRKRISRIPDRSFLLFKG